MKTDYRILLLEREEEVEQVADLLKAEYLPCELVWVTGREAFLTALKGGWSYDLLLVAEPQAEFSLQEALALARRRCPHLPVILLGDGDEELAAECLRQGAAEVVAKSAPARLAPAVRRALKESRDQSALREAEAEIARMTSLLRAVMESTAEGILVVDLAGKITTYNRKFMSLCGIPEYVMAPMDLERVLRFLQDQFADPETFLSEARILGDQGERKPLGFLNSKDRRIIEAFGRSQRMGKETVGKVFSFADVTEREHSQDPMPETLAFPPDLMEAARAGRVALWSLSEDGMAFGGFASGLLGLDPEALPRDIDGLEALLHPGDADRLRVRLENPGMGAFEMRMRRADGAWISTLWSLDRGSGGWCGTIRETTPLFPWRPASLSPT